MKRFFHDYGKQILAVLGVVLMITFFLPSSTRNGRSNGENTSIATIFGGDNITAGQGKQFTLEYDELGRLELLNSSTYDQPDQLHSVLEILGPATARAMNEKAFMLLVLEAQKLGISVDGDELASFVKNQVGRMPDENSDRFDVANAAVHDILLVNNLLMSVGSADKVSVPAAKYILATRMQELSVNVVQLPLSRYRSASTEPTTQQVEHQYALYSKVLPGLPSPTNQLGVGYAVPDRVKLQYIGVARADVRVAAINKQSTIDWRTQARRYYRQHAAMFMPSSAPSTMPTTQVAATTQPSWEELSDEVVRKVYDQVYDDAANDLTKQIMKQISSQLDQDYASFQAGKGRAQTSPSTATYTSDDYLRKMSDALASQYNIRPILGYTGDEMISAKQIDAIDPFGHAESEQGQKVSQVITTGGDQFAASKSAAESSRLALFQPSAVVSVSGMSGSTHSFIFRIVGMDPEHASSLNDVREQVVSDLRTQQAWDLAQEDGRKLIADAGKRGLETAAIALSPPTPVTQTGSFSERTFNGAIPGMSVNPQSVVPFVRSATELLGRVTASQPHPLTQVILPADGSLAVLELRTAAPLWDAADSRLENEQLEVAYAIQHQDEQELLTSWASYDSAAARTKYAVIERK